MHDGPYTLATISDDGSWVYVDGQLVVDNGGRRGWPRGATGPVTLTRGVHAIYVRYAQEGGPLHLELLWARAGQPLETDSGLGADAAARQLLGVRAERGAGVSRWRPRNGCGSRRSSAGR